MSDQERCPTCGSDKKEAQWCRICKAPYQDGGICVRSWLPKTHTFSHCSHPWHDSAPSSVAEQPQPVEPCSDHYDCGDCSRHLDYCIQQSTAAICAERDKWEQIAAHLMEQLEAKCDPPVVQPDKVSQIIGDFFTPLLAEQPSREQAVEGLVEALREISQSGHLSGETISQIALGALAHYEASRGGKQ